jgi:hypothetical protein
MSGTLKFDSLGQAMISYWPRLIRRGAKHMAILYGHTQHTQDVPDMAYEAHSFGSHTQGTQVYEVPNSENTHTFQASGFLATDEAHTYRLYQGMRVPQIDMEPRARLAVKAKFPVIDHTWRTSDKPTGQAGRLECTHEGCDWWCGAHNPDKMTAHVSKKHGGA